MSLHIRPMPKRALIPHKKKWAVQVTSYRYLVDGLLSLAKGAGCAYLFAGLESISAQGLKDVNKLFNQVEQYGAIVSQMGF